jgi:hypothetical protein
MARRAGNADLPLHGGRVPKWLGDHMTRLRGVPALEESSDHAPAWIETAVGGAHRTSMMTCVRPNWFWKGWPLSRAARQCQCFSQWRRTEAEGIHDPFRDRL